MCTASLRIQSVRKLRTLGEVHKYYTVHYCKANNNYIIFNGLQTYVGALHLLENSLSSNLLFFSNSIYRGSSIVRFIPLAPAHSGRSILQRNDLETNPNEEMRSSRMIVLTFFLPGAGEVKPWHSIPSCVSSPFLQGNGFWKLLAETLVNTTSWRSQP